MNELEKAIIRTISYFDVLDYPLTAVEVWRWLYNPPLINDQPPDVEVVAEFLKTSPALQAKLELVEGFYCLQGRGELIPLRKQRNLDADKQMRKAVRFAKLFRLIPSVKLIAVCSSLASGNVKTTSDIDLFIVTKPGTIWTSRFILVSLLKFMNQRPTLTASKDKICLSYYVTEDALGLEGAQIGQDDIVFTYYVDGFLPLYDADGTRHQLFDSNQWVYKRLPNSQWQNATVMLLEPNVWLRIWHKFFNLISKPFFNRYTRDWYCNLQLKILPDNLKSRANLDSKVVVSDRILKFHDKDNRAELRQQWLQKVNEVLE